MPSFFRRGHPPLPPGRTSPTRDTRPRTFLRAMAGGVAVAALLGGGGASAQVPQPRILASSDEWTLQGLFQAGVNGVAETNLFWNLADVPDLDFASDTQWLESYVKPGLRFELRPGGRTTLYAKLSAVASSSLGTDAFDNGSTGRITLEEAHVGYRVALGDSSSLDFSVGPRELRLGTGMLIANGGVSGFERGALKLGPRKAWGMAALAEWASRRVTGTLFYLDPNELPSNETGNRLAGADLNYRAGPQRYAGVSYVRVVQSDAPYPQAGPGGQGPPTITFGAREDLNAVQAYGRTNPLGGRWSGLFTAVDVAYQWNPRIDLNAWGGRVQVGYAFQEAAWRPELAGSYQIFSGDDPETPELERFDPLYYEGSPSAWSTGSKSSMVFINSNVQSAGASLRVMPTRQDIFTLRYASISAHRLLSPIQFGQAARVDFSDGDISTVITGVTSSRVADDLFLEYNRVVSGNVFLNAGLSVSFPGDGIQSIVGSTTSWTGGYLNVVVNY